MNKCYIFYLFRLPKKNWGYFLMQIRNHFAFVCNCLFHWNFGLVTYMFVCFCQGGESEKTSVVREGNGGADLCGCGRGGDGRNQGVNCESNCVIKALQPFT